MVNAGNSGKCVWVSRGSGGGGGGVIFYCAGGQQTYSDAASLVILTASARTTSSVIQYLRKVACTGRDGRVCVLRGGGDKRDADALVCTRQL